MTGTFTQGGQALPLTFMRGEQAAALLPKPPRPPKPDYSAPADAPQMAGDAPKEDTNGPA